MTTLSENAVTIFAEAARGFCSWCERSEPDAEPEISASVWLSNLHATALRLPQVESENSDGLPDVPEGALAQAKRNLAYFYGFYYREYFDPDPRLDEEPVIGDVGDDLLDIYKDIRAGLVLFESGQTTEALWHWSFLHQVHWGRHAVGASFALHCMHVSKQR